MKTAVVCIAIHEEPYIFEFINYYINKLKVDHVYIYDNTVSNTLIGCSHDPRVSVIHFPGKQKQLPAYFNFICNYSQIYDWVCFFDVDEFLYLNGLSLQEFLSSNELYENISAIGFQWKIFGSSGKLYYSNEPVTKRFQKCQKKIDKHIKTILKPKDYIGFNNPHYFNTTRGTFDPYMNPIVSPISSESEREIGSEMGSGSNIFLAHYFTKSAKEFGQKIERGRSDIKDKRDVGDFIRHDHNEVFDSSVWDFYCK
jgi:hypothetical protein